MALPGGVDDFLCFLQCQLRMEAQTADCGNGVSREIPLPPTGARIWEEVSTWIRPNLPSGKWVPYHTVLGTSERWLLQHVHSNEAWDEKQRWVAMFVFRGHGRPDFFEQVQMPLMKTASTIGQAVEAVGNCCRLIPSKFRLRDIGALCVDPRGGLTAEEWVPESGRVLSEGPIRLWLQPRIRGG